MGFNDLGSYGYDSWLRGAERIRDDGPSHAPKLRVTAEQVQRGLAHPDAAALDEIEPGAPARSSEKSAIEGG
jgi:hypothetical protein